MAPFRWSLHIHYSTDHNMNGLLNFKIELISKGKQLTANRGLRYIPKNLVLNFSYKKS